jgi:hypothetical protein
MLLMGFLDLVITIVGMVFFGAVEVNPLLSGLTQTSILFLVGIKSSAVLFTGFLFYKGASIAELSVGASSLGIRFLEFGYFASLTFLTIVVANNIVTIFQLT